MSAKIEFYITLFIIFMVTFGSNSANSKQVFNVMDFGAVADARTDNSQAFMKAWESVCGANTTTDHESSPTLLVPVKKMFLLKPVTFSGPCNSPNIHVQIRGAIVAPRDRSGWTGPNTPTWIVFENVNGLILYGPGLFDGKGAYWWKYCTDESGCLRPSALTFSGCKNLHLSGLTHINSQRNHISISGCEGVTISNIKIIAPQDSPNTDGIDISHSTNIRIQNSFIGTGDDCVAINDGSSFINITSVNCGPGHGISIGSLGKNGAHQTVEEVHVKNCTFNSTMNGARIKTWQGGSGYVRKVSFEGITLIGANNPIIIDQFYCIGQYCTNKTTAVKISDISYSGVYGTSMTDCAINLSCSKSVGCTQLVLENINVTSLKQNDKPFSYCLNAHGVSKDTSPPVNCLLSKDTSPPVNCLLP